MLDGQKNPITITPITTQPVTIPPGSSSPQRPSGNDSNPQQLNASGALYGTETSSAAPLIQQALRCESTDLRLPRTALTTPLTHVETAETSANSAPSTAPLKALGEWFALTSGLDPKAVTQSAVGVAALKGDYAGVKQALDATHSESYDYATETPTITRDVAYKIALFAAATQNQQALLEKLKAEPNVHLDAGLKSFYEVGGAIAGGQNHLIQQRLHQAPNTPPLDEETLPVNLGILAMNFAARLGNDEATNILFSHPLAAIETFGPGAVQTAAEHHHQNVVTQLLKNPALYRAGRVPDEIGATAKRTLISLVKNNDIPFDVCAVLHQEQDNEPLNDALEHRHNQAIKSVNALMHSASFQSLSEDQQSEVVVGIFGNALFPRMAQPHRSERIHQLVQHINFKLSEQ